jgi:pyruvate/2-oxoglutarate dehydrogenase complex dihydrolipoamide dehydrogenase (E3) component
MKSFDCIVIGGGAGGLTTAAGAASLGARVALIERAPTLGGDCLHTGCIPSKALISVARKVHTMHATARTYGCTIVGEADYVAVRKYVHEAIAHIQVHDDIERFRRMGIEVVIGHGRLIGRRTVHVTTPDGDVLVMQGARIVLATGSRPHIPDIPGLESCTPLTNETVFSLPSLPKSLVVLGGGAIGVELAQAFARLGTRVTILERGSRILPREEPTMAARIDQTLREQLEVCTDAHIVHVRPTGVTARVQGVGREWNCDALLVATGRIPNTEQLGVRELGMHMHGAHIAVDETMQTSIRGVFAVGDIVPTPAFTHVAGSEGRAVVANALFGLRQKVPRHRIPWTVYTDPELFRLGMTEEEARAQYGDGIRVFETLLEHVDRFVAERETEGLVKLITTRRGHIVGAHAVGAHAGDWMHSVVYAQAMGKRIGSLSTPVYAYPSRAAAVQRVADAYWRETLFSGFVPKLARQWVRIARLWR